MPADLSGIRILVIDDSKDLLEVFQLIFEQQGINAITKTSALDIAAFVEAERIDLLIIDVILNGANGRQICRQLKSKSKTNYFPIVLMSASPEYLFDPHECGADDTVEKPFDIKLLMKKIKMLVKS